MYSNFEFASIASLGIAPLPLGEPFEHLQRHSTHSNLSVGSESQKLPEFEHM